MMRAGIQRAFKRMKETTVYAEAIRAREAGELLVWDDLLQTLPMDPHAAKVIKHLRTSVLTSRTDRSAAWERLEGWSRIWLHIYRAEAGYTPHSDTESEKPVSALP